LTWLLPVVGVLLGVFAIVLVLLAIASLRAILPVPAINEPPTAQAPIPSLGEPEVEASPLPEITISPRPTSTTAVTPSPTPTSTAVPQPTATPGPEFVRIANTGGSGAFIRREPRTGAPGIVAHRDGTVLRVVGPDTTVEGAVWRHVEDPRGNNGWTPQQYLEPSPTGF
jgi:hypothetical protein